MNEAHFHLLVNHFPILMPIIGALILIGGIVFRSEVVKRAAYFTFLVGAIMTIPTYSSGEGAEEIVEHMGGAVSHDLIHEHEEVAELFAVLSYALGALALLGFFASWRKMKFSGALTWIVLLAAAVVIYFGRVTGSTGGEISHPEIRKGFKPTEDAEEEHDEQEH